MSKRLSMVEKMQGAAAAKRKLVDTAPEEATLELRVVDDVVGDGQPESKIQVAFGRQIEYVGRTLHLQQSTLDAFDDWVDDQRRKKRKRQIAADEPANVQQCADHVIRLGLAQLGYKC